MMNRRIVLPILGSCWLTQAFISMMPRGPVHQSTKETVAFMGRVTAGYCGQSPHSPPQRDRPAPKKLHGYSSYHLDNDRMDVPKIHLFNCTVFFFHGWVSHLLTLSFLLCCQHVQAARPSLVDQGPFWLFRANMQVTALIQPMLLS